VSQQIKRLEDMLGCPLLRRNGKQATPTEEGERLLSYARRILALAAEARDVVARPAGEGVLRLGIPEEFAAYRLTELLSEFARARPGLRLEVRCGLTSRRHPIDFDRDPLPLAVSEQGCLYRNRMIHAAEAAGRAWHIAYTSPNLPGIQAAVSAGLGVSILPEVAIRPEHRMLGPADGFPPITDTEVALVAAPDASPATHRLATLLVEFCNSEDPRAAA
jgi:DNA-binding transcriptional LysR family regulator